MSAILTISSTDYDLYFAPPRPQDDVRPLNPMYKTSGLVLPPDPTFPAGDLNTLVWPVTGLSHYAYGHVLVANEVAVTLGTTCTLKLTDAAADSAREFALYVLDRRPYVDTRATLGTAPASDDDGVLFDGWVLTLVDARFLRRSSIKPADAIASNTWGDLIHDLITLAGFTSPSASAINAKVLGDFGNPTGLAWAPEALQSESYSVGADAAAMAVGLRILYAPDGTVYVDTAANSETRYAAWLSRNDWRTGGISVDRYAAPLRVRCDGDDVNLPSPTPRLADTDVAMLDKQTTAFRTAWVQTFSDWAADTAPHGTLNGFPLPPMTGAVQHVQYRLSEGVTRVHAHPARYPLPFTRNFNARPGASAFPAGPRLNVVTNVCDDAYGVRTLEMVTITLPAGATVSAPWCVDAPDCCVIPDEETETVACCPDTPLPHTLYATVAGRGTFPLLWDGFNKWVATGNWPECANADRLPNGDWIFYVECVDTDANITPDTWRSTWNGGSTFADSTTCDPLQLVFLDCDLHATGGPCAATLYDITVTT